MSLPSHREALEPSISRIFKEPNLTADLQFWRGGLRPPHAVDGPLGYLRTLRELALGN
jgi:hypothetical protein